MSSLHRYLFTCLLLLLPTSGHSADLTIQLLPQQQQRHFTQPQRLHELLRLHPAARSKNPYWSGAFLADLQQQYLVQQERQTVIAQLEQQARTAPAELAQQIRTLVAQLVRAPLAARQVQQLDPDLLRLRPELNPLLQGSYLLAVPPRPTHVDILGLVASPGRQPWRSEASANHYLQQAKPLAGAEKNQALLIQPDGVIQIAPIAYWNHQPLGIAPGATLFLGFNGDDALNMRVAKLLVQRVPE